MDFKNKTLILITHRIEMLEHFDMIYVMEDGRIVERGNYR